MAALPNAGEMSYCEKCLCKSDTHCTPLLLLPLICDLSLQVGCEFPEAPSLPLVCCTPVLGAWVLSKRVVSNRNHSKMRSILFCPRGWKSTLFAKTAKWPNNTGGTHEIYTWIGGLQNTTPWLCFSFWKETLYLMNLKYRSLLGVFYPYYKYNNDNNKQIKGKK